MPTKTKTARPSTTTPDCTCNDERDPGCPRHGTSAAARKWRADNAPAALRGKARKAWIEDGLDGDAQRAAARAAISATRRSSKKAAPSPQLDGDAKIAAEAFEIAASSGKPLSQRITPAQIEEVRKAIRKVGGKDAIAEIPAAIGVSAKTLRQIATGEIRPAELGAKPRESVKALTKAVGNHQMWARKVIACTLGLHLADKAGR